MARVVRIELDSGATVCEHCLVAADPWRRLRGLMFASSLDAGHGLLIRPCSSVHTSFMRFPIDVVFCTRDLEVLSVAAAVRPWRMRGQRGAKVVVELAAGEAARRGIQPGATLRLVETSPFGRGPEGRGPFHGPVRMRK